MKKEYIQPTLEIIPDLEPFCLDLESDPHDEDPILAPRRPQEEIDDAVTGGTNNLWHSNEE